MADDGTPELIFFTTPADFRRWLRRHHASRSALRVGFHKKHTGAPSITWPESVDEALCYGWIDGVRRAIDDRSFEIRFTPRRPTSVWSARNIARVEALTAEGRMKPAGRRVFDARSREKSGYSSERKDAARLGVDDERTLRADERAWAFFEAQIPSYRRDAIYWVTDARRAETRARRLTTLIDCCRRGVAIPPLRSVTMKMKPAPVKKAKTKAKTKTHLRKKGR